MGLSKTCLIDCSSQAKINMFFLQLNLNMANGPRGLHAPNLARPEVEILKSKSEFEHVNQIAILEPLKKEPA